MNIRIPSTSQLFSGLPNGAEGVRATLTLMCQLKRIYRVNPKIRALSMRLIRDVEAKDTAGEAAALHAFVRDNIRYCRDVVDVETVQTPVITLELGQGDCDDSSLLLATMAESVGIRSRFMAMGFGKNYSHVMAQLDVGGRWLAAECTEPWELGEQRGTPKVKMTMG